MVDLKTLPIGTKINYGLFSNITFNGTDELHALMIDRSGNEKKVYKELFEQHASIANVNK